MEFELFAEILLDSFSGADLKLSRGAFFFFILSLLFGFRGIVMLEKASIQNRRQKIIHERSNMKKVLTTVTATFS